MQRPDGLADDSLSRITVDARVWRDTMSTWLPPTADVLQGYCEDLRAS